MPSVALVIVLLATTALAVLALGWRLARARRSAERRRRTDEARDRTRLLASLGHELRTPLHGVIGMSQLLQETQLDATQRRFLESLQRSATHLLGVVEATLDLARAEAGRLELELSDVDLHAAVEDVAELLAQPARSRGLELACRIDDDVPRRVRADGVRIKQVLTNLLGNAVKFTERGEVVVRVARGAELDPDPASGAQRASVEITVSDTGIGITAEARARIFEPFAQAHASTARRFGGTGLGLFVSRQLADLMGGDLEVSSEAGRGSCFRFRVPVCVAPEPAGPPVDPCDRAPARQAVAARFDARLLLVEDDDVSQEVTVAMLQSLGCEVHTARGGREALAMLEQGPVDLVFMDCQLPGMEGLGATREIRARSTAGRDGRRLPVVALTGRRSSEERDACLAAGMDDFLAKPFTKRELQAALDRWLAHTKGSVPDPPFALTKGSVLDPSVLAQVRQLEADGASGLLARVTEAFLSLADGVARGLRDALADSDVAALAGAAHTLKSSSAQVGATRLSALAKQLEAQARDGSMAEAEEGVAELLAELEQVAEALAVERFGVSDG